MFETEFATLVFAKIDIFIAQLFRTGAFVFAELCSDILDTGPGLDAAQPEMFRDGLLQIGRDKSFDDDAA